MSRLSVRPEQHAECSGSLRPFAEWPKGRWNSLIQFDVLSCCLALTIALSTAACTKNGGDTADAGPDAGGNGHGSACGEGVVAPYGTITVDLNVSDVCISTDYADPEHPTCDVQYVPFAVGTIGDTATTIAPDDNNYQSSASYFVDSSVGNYAQAMQLSLAGTELGNPHVVLIPDLLTWAPARLSGHRC